MQLFPRANALRLFCSEELFSVSHMSMPTCYSAIYATYSRRRLTISVLTDDWQEKSLAYSSAADHPRIAHADGQSL